MVWRWLKASLSTAAPKDLVANYSAMKQDVVATSPGNKSPDLSEIETSRSLAPQMSTITPFSPLPPQESAHKRPLSFLDLPAELRLHIYGYFAYIPPTIPETPGSEHRSEVIETRHSLQLVCRAVNKEWSAIFYSTTTIVANKLSRRHGLQYHDGRKHLNQSPQSFEVGFLEALPAYRLGSIQKIHYNISGTSICGLPTMRVTVNDNRVWAFAAVLSRHLASLQSLCELTLVSDGLQWIHLFNYRVESECDRTWAGAAFSYGHTRWQSTQRMYQLEMATGALSRWSVLRRMHLRSQSFGYSTVDEVQMVFRKHGKATFECHDSWIELPGYKLAVIT